MTAGRKQIIAAGLLFHLLAAVFSVGYHHCDELFQVYEFAGYKLGLNSAADLPWEFHEQMRSGIQPFFVYVISRICHAGGLENPFTIAMLVRLLQSMLSFAAALLLADVLTKEMHGEKERRQVLFLSLLMWIVPYFHARFSSENFAATLFVLGFVVAQRSTHLSYFIAGILFGLAFHSRFQLAFMIAGYCAWIIFLNRNRLPYLPAGCAGILIALCAGFFADTWLYGTQTLSWWNYLDLNFFRGRASDFGSEPFYFYISEALVQLAPPFSLLLLAGIIGFWIRFSRHAFTWITLPFVLLHFIVPHKELRFLFPVLYFIPFMFVACFGAVPVLQRITTHKVFVRAFLVVNALLLLYFSLKPADNISYSLKKIYEHVPQDASLLYTENDPYSNAAALNYFRRKGVVPARVDQDSVPDFSATKVFYFHESFKGPAEMQLGDVKFRKVYGSFPEWFRHLDFNGWQDRSYSFSLYAAIAGN